MTNNMLLQNGSATSLARDTDAPEAPVARAACEDGAPHIFWHAGSVTAKERCGQFGRPPATVWLTGLSGSGKSTIAYELEKTLMHSRWPCAVLDGDNLRHRLNRDLGFSEADRRENIRRVAEMARLMNDAGLTVIASLISPYRDDRAMACEIIGPQRYIEVYVSTPLDVCEARDPKGLYRKARSGEIPHFTGISSPYQPSSMPALVLDTARLSLAAATAALHGHLLQRCAGDDDRDPV